MYSAHVVFRYPLSFFFFLFLFFPSGYIAVQAKRPASTHILKNGRHPQVSRKRQRVDGDEYGDDEEDFIDSDE
jgi:hypothetical protein